MNTFSKKINKAALEWYIPANPYTNKLLLIIISTQ